MITDTHAHIFWESFDEDRAKVVERARAGGVDRIVVVGTDLPSSRSAFELCAGEAGLYPTSGVHPHDAAGSTEEVRAEIDADLERQPVTPLETTAYTMRWRNQEERQASEADK